MMLGLGLIAGGCAVILYCIPAAARKAIRVEHVPHVGEQRRHQEEFQAAIRRMNAARLREHFTGDER